MTAESTAREHPSCGLVSVIMPIYNGDRFLEKSIQSVLKQTYSYLELIIIDDGSCDRSRSIINRLATYDSRIRLLFRDKSSGGPAAPRNLGLDVAQGKYVAFLDCDDTWFPDKLERQLCMMLETRSVASYTAYFRVRENGEVIRRISVPERLSYQNLLMNTAIAASSVIIKRDVIGSERFLPVGHEDYEFWLRLARRHGVFVGLNQSLLNYRVVAGSVSSKRMKTIFWTWRIYRDNQRLSLLYSAWCIVNYGIRALLKRL